jgi:hypothetical protein
VNVRNIKFYLIISVTHHITHHITSHIPHTIKKEDRKANNYDGVGKTKGIVVGKSKMINTNKYNHPFTRNHNHITIISQSHHKITLDFTKLMCGQQKKFC